MYALKKQFTISCSHRLYDNKLSKRINKRLYGKCANLPSHGHNFKVTLYLESPKLVNGMIMNFNKIKEIFKSEIDDVYDHQFLNNCQGFKNIVPSSENMCEVFFNILKKRIDTLYSVGVSESDGASVIYEKD